MSSPWTEDVAARFYGLLKKRPPLRYSQIARIMSEEFGQHFTTNSCIGFARRNGVAARPPNRWSRKSPAGHFPEEPPKTVHNGNSMIDFWNLEPHHCRWPHGEKPPYWYCGAPTFSDSSWCFHHARIAFPAVGRAR